MRPKTVIIIAPKTDAHAQVVAKRINSLGSQALILDSALFPSQWSLTVHLSRDSSSRFVLEFDGKVLNDEEVAGVWWRRPQRHLPPNVVEERHLRQFVVNEARQAFEGWLLCMGKKVINPIASDEAASHKLLQLQCATEIGLKTPKTLATNSPQMVKSFCDTIRSNVVFKPFTGTDWQFTGTQRLTEDTLEHLNSVAFAPVIFQEEIKKVADIRVNIIDEQVFSLIIRSKRYGVILDWRIDPDRDYASHKLPQEIENSLIELLSRLDLRFGACDLALTEKGDYVFFEINPGGQWLFAEIMADQKISWAFARALLNS